MKVLDLERKGNVVRFYLGDDSLKKWWGDDWDDAPYECNAGPVYERFILAEADAVFPFECGLYDAHNVVNKGESYEAFSTRKGYAKIHYVITRDPYLWVLPGDNWCDGVIGYRPDLEAVKNIQKIRLGMPWDECHKAIKAVGGFLIGGRAYNPEDDNPEEGEKDGN